MDALKLNFLSSVVGQEGSTALKKAVERYPPLESVLVPRAILSWLSVVARTGFKGELPGIPDSYLDFSKTEADLFAGLLSVNGNVYPFENASFMHVVAGVSVALNADLSADHGIKDSDLVNLGRQVDLLTKSEFVAEHSLPPIQIALEKAIPLVEANLGAPQVDIHPPRKPKKKKIKTFEFKKSQLTLACSVCGCPQVDGNSFKGCMCTTELARFAKLSKTDDVYTIEFGSEWGEDELSLLFSITGEANG